MSQGLLVTLFSMSVVFLALLAISYVIDIMRMMLAPKPKKAAATETIIVKEPVDENELPVVMMAAIEQFEKERLVNPIARSQEGSYKSCR